MRSPIIGSLILLSATITACRSTPPTEQLTQELKTVTSWVATSHMVGEAWLKKDVPTAYAKQTLLSATKNLQKETEAINKIPPTQQRAILIQEIQQLQQSISKMNTAIEQQNNSTVAQQVQTLSNHEKSLHSLMNHIGTLP